MMTMILLLTLLSELNLLMELINMSTFLKLVDLIK